MRPDIKRLSELAARETLAAALLVELVGSYPVAEIAELTAEIEFQEAAAAVIEARRWARWREHSAELDKLAASEGAISLQSERFDKEGGIALEFKGRAASLRQELQAKQERLNRLRGAE